MPTVVSPFTVFLAEHYTELKQLATEIGRRRAKLRLLEAFWSLPLDGKERLAHLAEDSGSIPILSDALRDINSLSGQEEAQISEYLDDTSVAGVVVRTDFSNDTAWQYFVETLLQAERDLAMPIDPEESSEHLHPGTSDVREEEEESESESEDEEPHSPGQNDASSASPASLFALLSPPASSPLRELLIGASNLTALRLVNEVGAVRVPVPASGTEVATSASPEHRLTGMHGFVEAYYGPLVWIYDSRSNTDQAARVVSQCAEGIGSATADSWRARVSFLAELQINLIGGAMKIDFGGLDRWDHVERQRNLAEAATSASF